MSTTTIEIDMNLLAQLVKRGLIELAEQGERIIATAGKRLSLSPAAADSAFEEFYRAYPRKKGKAAARKAWAAATKNTPPADIMAGLHPDELRDVARRRDPHDPARLIPHPATWLNQERWLDEREGVATVHEKVTEVLAHELRPADEEVISRGQRLSEVVRAAIAPPRPQLAAPEDEADLRDDERFDPWRGN